MNIHTKFDRPEPTLISAMDVPVGQVYSWGAKLNSYLRVNGGSVYLGGVYNFLPSSHSHFGPDGPRVQVAERSNLTIEYEG